MPKGTIIIGDVKRVITAAFGDDLLSALSKSGISLSAPCGGNHRCGKCRVEASGGVSPASDAELELIKIGGGAGNTRLACFTQVTGDFTAVVPKDGISVETDGMTTDFVLSPIFKNGGYGLAVDVGTTTVALYFCSLETGKCVYKDSFANPQRGFGADVISRIEKICGDYSTLELMRNMLFSEINASVGRSFIDPDDINAVVMCGNTVMQHIAAALDPRAIAKAPFTPSSLFGISVPAKDAGLRVSRAAEIYFAPCIASYVGGDIVCGAVASDSDLFAGTTLYIDIGTNGEIGLFKNGEAVFCATAAGPAFEGAHIKKGMPGTAGAINTVSFENGRVEYGVIGGGEPFGICGSGVIDAVFGLLSIGAADETGRLSADNDYDGAYSRCFTERNGEEAFLIDEKSDIYIAASDVREIQLAKAAVAAGVDTLFDYAGITAKDVDRVVIAGGFGAHIDVRSACGIGLIEKNLSNRTVIAGNTAGTGAVALLLGEQPRERARRLKEKAKYLELSENDYFRDAYIDRMVFD
ncbi:MAG: DUF4445 domain-containing protein [Clostridia bacterium]|nr:DUF4445 domain-containing protein [Clostridia bacterium]